MNANGTPEPSRREVLGWMAASGAAAVTPLGAGRRPGGDHVPLTAGAAAPTGARTPTQAGATDRALVVIELPGGNDGLSMLVPKADGRYRDLRPTTSLPEERLVPFDRDMLLNTALLPLHEQGLAVLDGIGAAKPGLSHFDMSTRWWAGSPDSNAPLRTAFLGRVCDRLGERESLTGVTIDVVASQALQGERGTTTGRPDGTLVDPVLGGTDGAREALRRALGQMGRTDRYRGVERSASASLARMAQVDEALAGLPPPFPDYPTGEGTDTQVQMADLATKLAFAGQLLRSDLGVRVIHIRAERLFFDSHERHLWAHQRCMDVVVPNIAAFRRDLADAGLTDRVLVGTTSEFGRRPREHMGGLDHGTASCALLMGPVEPGLHGEPASLKRLDDDGNLRATMSFNRYYATMAEWLGVDPTEVLTSRARPVPGLLRT